MDIPSDPSVVFVQNLLTLSELIIWRYPNTLPKGWKEWGRGFSQAAFVFVFQKGEDGSGSPRGTHSICHGFASHYQANKLGGFQLRVERRVQRVTRVLNHLTCYPVSSISPFISMTKKKNPSNLEVAYPSPHVVLPFKFLWTVLLCLSTLESVISLCNSPEKWLCLIACFQMHMWYSIISCYH